MEDTKKIEVPGFLYELLQHSAADQKVDVKTIVRRMFVRCYGSNRVQDALIGKKLKRGE